MNKNLNEIPYAQWLENALRELIEMPVEGICLAATLKDGSISVDYHKVPMSQKLVISGLIQQDAMLDTLAANGLIEYADEEDESNGEEEVS